MDVRGEKRGVTQDAHVWPCTWRNVPHHLMLLDGILLWRGVSKKLLLLLQTKQHKSFPGILFHSTKINFPLPFKSHQRKITLVLPVTNHYAFLIKLAEELGWDVVGDVQRDRHLDSAPVEILLVSYYALAKFQRRRFWHDSFISIRWYFAFEKNIISSNLFTVCISSSILKISPLVGEECRDQFLLGIAEEFAEFAAEGFRVGSFESMFASDILLDSFWESKVTHLWIQKWLSKIPILVPQTPYKRPLGVRGVAKRAISHFSCEVENFKFKKIPL